MCELIIRHLPERMARRATRMLESIQRRFTAPDGATPASETSDADSRPTHDLSAIAIEVWRLERRIAASASADRIKDSHGRMVRALSDLQVEIRDPAGERFREGMNTEVLDMPSDVDPEQDELIISDVVRPGVFIDGRCVVPPQVIVERLAEEGVNQ